MSNFYISSSLSDEAEELSDVGFDFLFFGGAVSSSSAELLEELPDDDDPDASESLELSDSLSDEEELESDEDPVSEEPESLSEESDSLSELEEEPLEEAGDDE